jgi:hypothetical protein
LLIAVTDVVGNHEANICVESMLALQALIMASHLCGFLKLTITASIYPRPPIASSLSKRTVWHRFFSPPVSTRLHQLDRHAAMAILLCGPSKPKRSCVARLLTPTCALDGTLMKNMLVPTGGLPRRSRR